MPSQPRPLPATKPHVTAVAHHAEATHTQVADTADSWNAPGIYLRDSGNALLAPAQFERAPQIHILNPGTSPHNPPHPEQPRQLVLGRRAAFREAIDLQEQVLAHRVRLLSNDRPDTLAARRALDQWKDN